MREHILDTAIRLFRQRGFDETTMREVASEVGVALGLAYYYFPSKDALVMAYYERVQREHRIVAKEKLPHIRSLRDRLAMLLQTKLDILKDDRKLLGTLFRYTGSPEHPLSFLGKATAPLRADCMSLFAEALEPERMPEDLRELLDDMQRLPADHRLGDLRPPPRLESQVLCNGDYWRNQAMAH